MFKMENERIAVDKNWQRMSNRGQLKSTVVRKLSLIENNHKSRRSLQRLRFVTNSATSRTANFMNGNQWSNEG